MNQISRPAGSRKKSFQKESVIEQYQKRYVDINLERCGLFRTIRDAFNPREILYPGSSIHITPSFYFPHVVYIDRSDMAVNFFAAMSRVKEYIERKKVYRQSAYLRFMAQDYLLPLPLKEQQYDLLISLYAADAILPCLHYLKPGGLLLTQDIDIDHETTDVFKTFYPFSMIHFRKNRYNLRKFSTAEMKKPAAVKQRQKKFLHQADQGLVYREELVYYLYRKT